MQPMNTSNFKPYIVKNVGNEYFEPHIVKHVANEYFKPYIVQASQMEKQKAQHILV